MRIIAGQFKGRRLVEFKAENIRPTSDRMKETIFNILMHDISDARVLDLFSGTGNLGIEAFSRGANYVECVESHKSSLKIIRENLDLLKIKNEIKLVSQDVFHYLKSYKGDPFMLIFADPPYGEMLAGHCLRALASSRAIQDGSLVVIESSAKEVVEDCYGPLHLLDRRDFGDKYARFYQARLK